MTEKELRKLGRAELLELLLEQAREFEALEQRLNAAEAALQSRQLQLETCGSIAEASLKLNGVFEAAQKAVDEDGCVAIELCGGFGYEGAAMVARAVKVPVGVVRFDIHPGLGNASGDGIFA